MDAATRDAKMDFASLCIGGQFVAPGAGTQESITPLGGSVIAKALPGIVFSNFAQAGQDCACTTRIRVDLDQRRFGPAASRYALRRRQAIGPWPQIRRGRLQRIYPDQGNHLPGGLKYTQEHRQ
jgi:hypothetical protein